MSDTIRIYNKWAKDPLHPYYFYQIHKGKWWKQFSYGKSSCIRFKDDLVFIHVHNKRNRILLKKKDYLRI